MNVQEFFEVFLLQKDLFVNQNVDPCLSVTSLVDEEKVREGIVTDFADDVVKTKH